MDLDIFFLTEDLKVIDVDRDVKHHPGRTEPPPIVRTRSIVSFHILEIKASSPWAKALKPGDKLRWESKPSFDEILKNLNKFSGI